MDPEENKQHSSEKSTPLKDLEQVNSDFVLAISMQEQERAFSLVTTTESDTDEDDNSSFDDVYSDDAEFFDSLQFGADLEFLENEETDMNTDEEMEEDDIDPDDLSYEELIALGEFIGEEKKGMAMNEIPSCLRPYTNHSPANRNDIDRCVICQVEYEQGETLVKLQCEHPYHSDCVIQWLQIKKVCPICNVEICSPNISKIQ